MCQEPLMSRALLPRSARLVPDTFSDLAWGDNVKPELEPGHHGDSPPRRGSDSPADRTCTSPLASTLPAPGERPGSNPAAWPRGQDRAFPGFECSEPGRTAAPAGHPGRPSSSVRKIRGEEFTTRLEITFNVLLYLLDVDLAGFNPGMVQRHQEVSAAQAGDRGGLPLGDQSLVIPLDGCGDSHVPGKLLRRAPQC